MCSLVSLCNNVISKSVVVYAALSNEIYLSITLN